MEKLSINGGKPVRSEKLYYGRQWIQEDDIQAVNDVLRSDYITCGPKVDALEQALCEFTGAKYAVAVNSGTSALHCACIAAGIEPGDEVITTPITFAASAFFTAEQNLYLQILIQRLITLIPRASKLILPKEQKP